MNERLPALQGIRALATIGIFLFHSGFLLQGTFPVTLFFMLSGFLIYYNESSLEKYGSYKDWLGGYVVRKLKTFYPLHLVTYIISLFVGRVFWKQITGELILSGFLNLALLQPWFERFALGFNGLSWFLAITIFLYLIGYFLIRLTKKIRTVPLAMIVVLLIVCGLSCASRFIGWLYLYTNPAYRIFDFWLGMMCAKVYMDKKILIKRHTLVEAVIVLVFVIQYAVSLKIGVTPAYYSVLFAFALPVFAEGKGKISDILKCRAFDRIAYYSFEFYMIHELMLRTFRQVFTDESMAYLLRCALIAVPALILSALFAVGWKELMKRMRKAK